MNPFLPRTMQWLVTQCMLKHQALTTPGGRWPLDGKVGWQAGSEPAAREIASMLRTYAADIPPDERRACVYDRIWPESVARSLADDLSRRALDCRLYDATSLHLFRAALPA